MSTQLHVCERDGLVFRWTCADGARFHALVADLKRAFPWEAGLRFDEDTRAWRLPAYRRSALSVWANAHFAPDAQVWERTSGWTESRGGTGSQARNGRRGGRAERDAGSPLDAAYATLHLRPGAPLWAAEALYRAAQKRAHPDTGGTTEEATALNHAIALIRAACSQGHTSVA